MKTPSVTGSGTGVQSLSTIFSFGTSSSAAVIYWGNSSSTGWTLYDGSGMYRNASLNHTFRISGSDRLTVAGSLITANVPISVNLTTNSFIGLTIRGSGAAGSYTQTGDLTIWQSYDGTTATIVSRVDNNGIYYTGTISSDVVVISGTNTTGNSLNIISQPGTGNSTPTGIVFQTPTIGLTGSTLQVLATRLTLNSTRADFTIGIRVNGNVATINNNSDNIGAPNNGFNSIFCALIKAISAQNLGISSDSSNIISIGQTNSLTSNAGTLGSMSLKTASQSNASTSGTSNTGSISLITGSITDLTGTSGSIFLTIGTGPTRGGINIGSDSTTKIGHYGATAIVQPTTAFAGATLVSNGGTPLTDTDTFDGYTIKQMIKIIRSLGLAA
jgi:hypothetical protein